MKNIYYGTRPEVTATTQLFHRFGRVANSIQLPNTQNLPDENHRSVNLALETVLEFNNKDHSADVQLLDKVETILNKVKTVIGRNRNIRRDFRAVENVINLTDFIQEFFAILNTYPDPEFLDAFDILDEEIRKYHYRGCKFHELTENYDTRRLLATKLDLIRDQPVYAIKSYINLLSKILKQENYEKYVQDLLDYINSLYRKDAGEKFRKVLADFEHLNKLKGKRRSSDMVKVIRKGIRSIIFDHYTNLNPNARRELKSEIETFWKQYNTVKHSEIPVSVTKIINVSKIENSKTEIKIPDNIDNDHGKAVSVEKSDPKTAVLKTEENINTENHRGDRKWIEIKMSDYKIPGDRTHRMKLKDRKNERSKAPKFTYTNKDSGNIDYADRDVTLTTSRKEQRIYQPTMKKATTNQLLRSFSTEKILTGESFKDNSIEFEPKELAQMASAPQRYITLYSEDINTLKQAIKKKADKVIHRSKMIYSKPKLVTLWVEESTGRLPGAPRDKLSSKAHQRPKHKRVLESDLKKHKSGYNLKQALRYKAHEYKKRIKYVKEYSNFMENENKKKPVILTEGSSQIDVKVTALEMNEFKKMKPTKVVTEFETTPPLAATTTNIMVTEGTVFKYVKRNRLLPQTKLRDFRKFVLPVRTFNSNPGMSIEQPNHSKTLASLRKNYNNNTGGTKFLDQKVINRIKDLERDLKDVKSKMNDVKIDELIVGMDKHEPKQIGNQFEAKAKKETTPQELNLKKDQLKYNAENEIEYTTEMKVATGTETKVNEKKENKETPEMKGDYATKEVTKTVDNKVDINHGNYSKEKETKYDAKETELYNDKKTNEINLQNEKGTIGDLKVKLMNEDKQPHIKMHDSVGSNVYDDVDEWKDAFRSRMKFTNTKGTSTTLKTITQTETTTEATTGKPAEETTTPTRVETLIPVSIPAEFMPSYKPPNVIRKNEGTNLNLAKESVDPMSINPSKLDSTMAEPVLNISNLSGNNKDTEKEVMDILKINNITIPKDHDALTLQEVAGDPEGSPANFLNTISPPQENETDPIANILLTNPFKGEDELDFLTTF